MNAAPIAADIAHVAARMPDGTNTFALRGIDGWVQGRTMYGGASTFLAYSAARKAMPTLPPLRGAQIGFIAPISADMDIAVHVLREGKSVSQVQTDIFCEGVLAHRGLWLFGSARPSNGVFGVLGAKDVSSASTAEQLVFPPGMHFIHNLEIRSPTQDGTLQPGVVRRWVRLKNREALDPIGELMPCRPVRSA